MTLKEKFELLLNLFFALDDEEENEITDEEIANLLQKFSLPLVLW